jgi:predicted transcriptional regulator
MQQTEKGSVRDTVLEAVEVSLEAQLKAVKRLRAGQEDEAKPSKQGRSQVEMVFDILKTAQKPLHVTEILEAVERRFATKLDRESVVSALTKKVTRGDRFVRTDKNTFGLKGGK